MIEKTILYTVALKYYRKKRVMAGVFSIIIAVAGLVTGHV